MKRFIRIFLKTIFVLFVLLNLISAFHAYKFTHYYDPGEVTIKTQAEKNTWDKISDIFIGVKVAKQPNPRPDSAFSDVVLTTSDSLKLAGWYLGKDSSKGTVILFHGHGSNRSKILTEAYSFRELGYNIFLIDFRAHGNSEGNTCTIGYKEAEDVKLAFDYIKNKGETNIILWGISLGAATVTRAVHTYDLSPAKIILELPFASIMHAVKGRVKMMGVPTQPISTLLTFWGGIINGFWAFNHRPVDYVKSIKCPVLLQFGRNDQRVSIDEANAIYDNITVPKQIVFYETSGHQSLCANENLKWKNAVSTFLQSR